MTYRNTITYLGLCVISLSLWGCASTPPQTTPPEGMTTQDAYQAALQVLHRYHFPIDKADPEQGFIQTHALSSAQWFEPWRKDISSLRDFGESNLHSLRRTVTIQIKKTPSGAHCDCHVAVQRLSVPARPVTSSSQAYRILTDSEPMVQHLQFSDQQQADMTWIDLDDDTHLAQRLLYHIHKQVKKQQHKTL